MSDTSSDQDSSSQRSSGSGATKRRTRTGCITCRIRRVKCDEARPACQRCITGKRTCDGYAPGTTGAHLSRRALTAAVRELAATGHGPVARLLAGPQTPEETACFDFFRLRTAPTTGTFFASDFWDNKLLQVAHVEPAVWSAAASLGALHRWWEIDAAGAMLQAEGPHSASRAKERKDAAALGQQFAHQAAVCYGRALSQARTIRDPASMLVLSLALAAVANLSGKYADSNVHLTSGKRILAQIRASTSNAQSLLDELSAAAESLARLDLETLTFQEASAPYPIDDGLPPAAANPNRDPADPVRIRTLGQAALWLLDLMRQLLILEDRVRPYQPSSPEMVATQASIRAETLVWEAHARTFLDELAPALAERFAVAIMTLKMYHATVRTLLQLGLDSSQSKWDDCLAGFERIVATAAALMRVTAEAQPLVPCVVTLDPGVVMLLFAVVTRCRHPIVRRRALALMWRANRQEGRWFSVGSATLAEKVLEFEEEGLGVEIPVRVYCHGPDLYSWADDVLAEQGSTWLGSWASWTARSSWGDAVHIPEWKRVYDVLPSVELEKRRAEIVILCYPHGDGRVQEILRIIEW